ncbi:MAG: hypothetical protein QXI04_03055 [Desulfurococcaceae archaeon]
MQLLQELRNSARLEQIFGEIERIEKKAREVAEDILDFLTSSSSETLIYAYTGYGLLPASISYWFSVTMRSQSTLLLDVEDASLYVLPYREDVSMVVFSAEEYSKLFSSLQAARLLGVKYKAYAQDPVDERYKILAKHYSVNTVPGRNTYETSLLLSLSTFFAHSKYYMNSLQLRSRRLFTHGEEGFAVVAKSLIEKYTPILEKIFALNSLHVSSSRILEAPARLLTRVLSELGIEAVYTPHAEIASVGKKPLLVTYVSLEDRAFRELKAFRREGLLELVLNTDPLEAGIYLSIIAFVLSQLKPRTELQL